MVGYAGVYFIAELKNASGQPISNEVITFTSNVNGNKYGGFDVDTLSTDSDGRVAVTFSVNDGTGAVDNPSSPEFENVEVRAYYNQNTQISTRFDVYGTFEEVWPYTITSIGPDPENLIAGTNGTANVTCRLLNKNGSPVRNVIVGIDAGENGIIKINNNVVDSDTTDNNGEIQFVWHDSGDEGDVRSANIVSSFTHPSISSSVLDTSIVIIEAETVSDAVLSFQEVQPVANGISVGEAVVGYAGVLIKARLLNGNNQPISNAVISFSSFFNGAEYGGFDVDDATTNSDGMVSVTYTVNSGNGAVDNPSSPEFENVEVRAYYNQNTQISTRFDVYGTIEEVWPYTFAMTDPNPEQITLSSGASSNISCRLTNKLGNPVRDVIVQIEAGDKGYIEIDGNVANSDTTDNNGEINFSFLDNGEDQNIGIASIVTSFNYPSVNSTISDTSTISIVSEVGLVQECTYVEIPSSVPDNIVVRDGGGIESTSIKAKLYDDNNNLIDEPRLVRFTLNPILEGTYLEEPGVTDTSVYTVNGIATVSVNSGTAPGTVRVEVSVDCDEDGDYEINANAVPVIIASGAPYHIEPEYDPNSTTPIGGGFYKTQCAAIVYDKWYNPVEDSTYVYWSIDPIAPDTLIDAFVEGISYTSNENLDGDSNKGVAYSTIVYSTDAIGDFGRVRATTFGADGTDLDNIADSVSALINEDAGDAALFFLPGELSLTANATYHDFSLPNPTQEVEIIITAILIDFYGNPVVDAPISFVGTGVEAWREVGYEAYDDFGVDGTNGTGDFGEGNDCFSWRDYGADDDPQTADMGTFNEMHDAFDLDGDGESETAEVSEPFDDFGIDQIEGTNDFGEKNGKWDGYSMINCEPIVRTDQDGYARIIAVFPRELCIWQATDETTGICTFESFPASISSTLLIPQITTSDPLDITLVRTQTTQDCP